MADGETYVNSSPLDRSLDAALKRDKEKCDGEDLHTMWYHGKMTRNAAENILQEGKLGTLKT